MNYLIFFLGFIVGMAFITVLSAVLAAGRNPLIKPNEFDDERFI